ncbi:MAG: TIGR03790 family protein [Pseudomonadales bacterium]
MLFFKPLQAPAAAGFQATPAIELPRSGIQPEQLAVVFLQGDVLSEKIALYYAQQRKIPAKNVAAIALPSTQGVVEPADFAVQKKVLDAKLGEHIQAYALAWAAPYRVGCMSISAAFAFGFDVAYCAQGCKPTRSSPYYSSASVAPYRDFTLRPTMLLAAENFEDAQQLIVRGIAADDTQPVGAAYLLETSDRARSVRKVFFPAVQTSFAQTHRVHLLKQNVLRNASDILFYFTGLSQVEALDTLHFLPGAMADHLTSYGGVLPKSAHMTAMAWLQAGATASYGTAVEPCAFVAKFPNPYLAMLHYGRGDSLLEAYWKSVQMPGQGNFVGEPLAAPFRGYRLRREGRKLRVYSPLLYAGRYRVYASDIGIERIVDEPRLRQGQRSIVLEPPFSNVYRIERLLN